MSKGAVILVLEIEMSLFSRFMDYAFKPIRVCLPNLFHQNKKEEAKDKTKHQPIHEETLKPLRKKEKESTFKKKTEIKHEPVITSLDDDQIKQKMVSL